MKYSLKIKLRTDIQPDVNGECYIYFVYWYERKRLYIHWCQSTNWSVQLLEGEPMCHYPMRTETTQ